MLLALQVLAELAAFEQNKVTVTFRKAAAVARPAMPAPMITTASTVES